MSRVPAIPDVSPEIPEELRVLLDPIKRTIDVRTGIFDQEVKWITLQDLVDWGLLYKKPSGSYASSFLLPPSEGGASGSSAWGDITGTLSDQTDLQSALNAKASISGTPADLRIAVWTGATAIEGDPALRFNDANDRLLVGNQDQLTAAVEIYASATGTPTLSLHQAAAQVAVYSYNDTGDVLIVQSEVTGSAISIRPDETEAILVQAASVDLQQDTTVASGKYFNVAQATDTELNAIANAINTDPGKVQGSMVFNTTQNTPVWAVGSADGSVWVDGTGTTVNTPV